MYICWIIAPRPNNRMQGFYLCLTQFGNSFMGKFQRGQYGLQYNATLHQMSFLFFDVPGIDGGREIAMTG